MTLALAILCGILLGATVALLAVQLTRGALQSIHRSSVDVTEQATKVLEIALNSLQSKEREESRHRMIVALVSQVEKLDVTVGNLFGLLNSRTVLQRQLQVGEGPPSQQPLNRDRPVADWAPDLPLAPRTGLIETDPNAARQRTVPELAKPT